MNTIGKQRTIRAAAALALLVAFWLGMSARPQSAAAANCTTTVADGGDIQAAINAAVAGDVVCLEPGNYTPAATILINKALTLQGPMWDVDPRPSNGSTRDATDNTTEAIISGESSLPNIIQISADNVTLNGFVVTDAVNDLVLTDFNAAVSNILVTNLIAHETGEDDGIELANCDGCQATYNYTYDTRGDGINLCCNSNNGLIAFNEITGSHSNDGAIYVNESTSSYVQCNTVTAAETHGIVVGSGYSGESVVGYNAISGMSGSAIIVLSDIVRVEGNDITNNTGGDGGIFVNNGADNIEIFYNNIYDNAFSGTGGGITIGADNGQSGSDVWSDNNNIEGNTPYGANNRAVGTLTATNTWWGAADGPSGVGPGSGDAVSENIEYGNFLIDPLPQGSNPCTGLITIYKYLLDGESSELFEFDVSWSDSNTYLNAGDGAPSGPLKPGIYSIEEINLPPGWSLYESYCELNDEVNPQTADPSEIPLEAGQSWNCYFINESVGQPRNFCPGAATHGWHNIIGKGMGSTKKHKNQVKIAIPNWTRLESVTAQMVAKDMGKANWARFIMPGKGNYVQVNNPSLPPVHDAGIFYYFASLYPAKSVTGKWNLQQSGAKAHIPRALILYPVYIHQTNYYVSVAYLIPPAGGEVYWDTAAGWSAEQVFTIPIESNNGYADFTVKVAVVDNDKDKRPVWLTATAGGVTQTVKPTKPSNGDLLNIITFKLKDVPPNTDRVTLTLYSPSLLLDGVEGDSAAMVGATVNYQCEEAEG